jgi:hypothetical protein
MTVAGSERFDRGSRKLAQIDFNTWDVLSLRAAILNRNCNGYPAYATADVTY